MNTRLVYATACLMISAAMTVDLMYQNAGLRRDLAALRAAQAAVVVQPLPTEDACVAWLFHADLKGAKARMCGRR